MTRRTLRFHDFDAVLADATALLGSGYHRVGKWGLGEMAEHLARVMELSLDGFPSLFPWPMRLAARWFALGSMLRHRPFRMTFAAPPYLQPAPGSDDRAGFERLRAAIERVRTHAGPFKPSPVFGELPPEQWREVHLWHCEHHLSFLHPLKVDSR
jgi:hypothetical protein